MAEPRPTTMPFYDALRCDLINLLIDSCSQGRFIRAVEGTDQARALFVAELTRSIADILVTAYPKKIARGWRGAISL
jgi:hypothetical protein